MAGGVTRRHALALLALLAPSMAPAIAYAQGNYPEKPIRLVVALAAGGPADTAARAFGPFLAQVLGQSVVIENRPGASAIVGTESVTRATPDGYTLLFGSSSTFAVNPAVMAKLRFDAQKDLKLIRLIAQTPHVLTVRAAIPANSLDELVKLAKEAPGKLFYASSGNGGAIHLASELFKRETGTVINHIPFRGGGPAVLAVMSGDADVFINDASTTLPNIRAGSLRALAMLSPKRSELLPELPTSAELGYPGIVSSSWTGLAAPANTPEPIVRRLAEATDKVFTSEAYRAVIRKGGFELFGFDDAQTAAFIQQEVATWAAVAKSANIRLDQ
ncbi:MAG: tripartite tricarboxylate transporter substrate binding protein [Xanthobacteraceae bacterium]|nr:tripartite tricarboxylate transporter substrate binding protein [Xanthobacteraceae bacterium]